jgi:hypothetical protein
MNDTIELANASAIAVTLNAISVIFSATDSSIDDFKVTLKNIGAGVVTITPTTDTFDNGDATRTLAQYEYITIQTNNAGDKWNVVSDARIGAALEASQFLRSDENDTATGDLTLSGSNTHDGGSIFTGTMTLDGSVVRNVGTKILDTDFDANTLDGDKIVTGSITVTQMGTDSVDSDEIVAGAVGTSEIATGAVDTDELAADCVTAAKIGNDVINSEHYVAGSIDEEHLASNSVTAAKIAAGAVDASEIATNAVRQSELKIVSATLTGNTPVDLTLSSYSFFPDVVGTSGGASGTTLMFFSCRSASVAASTPKLRVEARQHYAYPKGGSTMLNSTEGVAVKYWKVST